jgi:hypothetical protein
MPDQPSDPQYDLPEYVERVIRHALTHRLINLQTWMGVAEDRAESASRQEADFIINEIHDILDGKVTLPDDPDE